MQQRVKQFQGDSDNEMGSVPVRSTISREMVGQVASRKERAPRGNVSQDVEVIGQMPIRRVREG
jgi:hypothetical protein